jgi:hypothetical protein
MSAADIPADDEIRKQSLNTYLRRLGFRGPRRAKQRNFYRQLRILVFEQGKNPTMSEVMRLAGMNPDGFRDRGTAYAMNGEIRRWMIAALYWFRVHNGEDQLDEIDNRTSAPVQFDIFVQNIGENGIPAVAAEGNSFIEEPRYHKLSLSDYLELRRKSLNRVVAIAGRVSEEDHMVTRAVPKALAQLHPVALHSNGNTLSLPDPKGKWYDCPVCGYGTDTEELTREHEQQSHTPEEVAAARRKEGGD